MWCFDVRHDGQSWSCRTVVASECRCMLVCQTFICHRERLFLLSHEIFRNLTNWHFLSRCKTNARCKPRVRPLYWRMCRVDGLAVCLRGGNRRVPACTSNLQKSKNSHCLAKAALGGSSDGRGGGRRPNKARLPGVFEVEDISPPRRSLGIHAFHPVCPNHPMFSWTK